MEAEELEELGWKTRDVMEGAAAGDFMPVSLNAHGATARRSLEYSKETPDTRVKQMSRGDGAKF